MEPMFKKNPKFQEWSKGLLPQIAIFTILKAYTFIMAGYCLIPFVYLSFHKWYAIYKKFYFIGHIVIIPMSIIWKPLIVKAMKIYFPLDDKAKENDPSITNNEKHEKSN